MNVEKLILSSLLDKYESSSQFERATSGQPGQTFSKRVKLDLYRKVREYNVEDTEVRSAFNREIKGLKAAGLVDFSWEPYEKDNIIAQVWLVPESLDRVYALLGRRSKGQRLTKILHRIDEIKRELPEAQVQEDTVRAVMDFLAEEEAFICEKNNTSSYLPNEEKKALDVLASLKELCRLSEDGCLERVFSIRCFGDSKYFEKNVRSRVVRILREHYPEINKDDEVTEEDVLGIAGVYRAPEQVEFCGPLQIRLHGRELDLGAFTSGACVNGDAVKAMEITGAFAVAKVLFIENKANYISFIRDNSYGFGSSDTLTVFHGGFYSPVKGLFFKKLHEAVSQNAQTEFYHWGDIDLGGFRIFNRLKRNIIPQLKPWRMDREAFYLRRKFWQGFDQGYESKLQELLQDDSFVVFWPVIESMLTEGARLEQEAFLV